MLSLMFMSLPAIRPIGDLLALLPRGRDEDERASGSRVLSAEETLQR